MTKEDVIEILERFVIGAKPCSQREIVDACASAYRMLKEQPSVPSNLNEAAMQFTRRAYSPFDDPYEVSKAFQNDVNCFKAGAEWLAGQGVTAEGEILDVSGRPLADRVIRTMSIKEMEQCLKDFNKGDKVVVQIRKK